MRLYKRLLNYIKPYWKLALGVSIFMVISAFAGVYPVQIVRHIVNKASEHKGSLQLILWGALTFLGFYLFLGILSYFQGVWGAKVGQWFVNDLRRHVYGHLQILPLSYYESRRTGEIMSRAIADIEALEWGIIHPLTHVGADICRIGWLLYFCFSMHVKLTLFALIILPALVLTTRQFGKHIRQRFKIAREVRGDLSGILQDNLSGIKEIQGFCREDYEMEKYTQKSVNLMDKNIWVAILFSFFQPSIQFIINLGIVIILFYGGLELYRGILKPGDLMAFFMYAFMLYEPVARFSWFYDSIQRSLAAAERVFEIVDTVPEVKDAPDAIQLPPIQGWVKFDNLSFSYQEGRQVLEEINLEAKPGEMIALVGSSGGGKTTIAKLIPRFYDATKGAILVDGYNTEKVTLHSLRQQIGIVFQESFLFNATVRENIAYGKLNATEEEIIEAARAANAHEFIMELPQGYDTHIGERGVKLSGGQRQRIAIARAILSDPRILILDEATSSVDTETEILIQEALERLMHNRTSFVIAHRLSTILHADQILVVEDGKIIEQGTHHQLLAKGQAYSRLYRAQFEARISEPVTSQE